MYIIVYIEVLGMSSLINYWYLLTCIWNHTRKNPKTKKDRRYGPNNLKLEEARNTDYYRWQLIH